jgi:hypothetical protein
MLPQTFEKTEECDSELSENGQLQKPKVMLLLQMIQSPARGLQNKDSRQPTLHGCKRQKILATTINR